jgi:hypothetical protein
MLVVLATGLGACAKPFSDDAPTFDDILSAGWLEDEDPVLIVPFYCYETIDAPDCHANPIPGEGGRLRGYEGPAPVLKVEP